MKINSLLNRIFLNKNIKVNFSYGKFIKQTQMPLENNAKKLLKNFMIQQDKKN